MSMNKVGYIVGEAFEPGGRGKLHQPEGWEYGKRVVIEDYLDLGYSHPDGHRLGWGWWVPSLNRWFPAASITEDLFLYTCQEVLNGRNPHP